MTFLYLDHAATTPVRPEVRDAMLPFLGEECPGNPSSIHAAGRAARKALEDARERVASRLGAAPREIVFTAGGTESDNLAILGGARANAARGKHVVTSAVEHHAVLAACDRLKDEGFSVDRAPVDGGGRVDPERLAALARPDTVLVSAMLANNEVGTVQPVAEIARLVRATSPRALVHTDAVQAAGKIPVDVKALDVDLLSLSAHKIYGPKGAGLLYVRKGTRLAPLLVGGEHEFGRRAGTENVAGIVGLAAALDLAAGEMAAEGERLARLRTRLAGGLRARIPDVRLNEHSADRLPHILSACFPGIDGEGIILHLDQEGIGVASGSACTSAHREPSHVLAAMGVPRELAASATRYSLGRSTTEGDIDRAVEATARAVARLRAVAKTAARR